MPQIVGRRLRRTAHRTTVISSRLTYPAHWWRQAENGRGEAARRGGGLAGVATADRERARAVLVVYYNDDNSNNNTR